ncbi:MAG TPA: hypothetical protein V6C50_02195 [Crinalium sp.]
MLSLLFAWTILFIFCSIIGAGVLNDLNASSFEQQDDRQLLAAWLGLVLLATGLLTTSLLLPLSPLVGLAVALALCGVALRSSSTRQEVRHWSVTLSRRKLLAVALLSVGVAAIMVQPVVWIDTGLYHYSLIQWLARFSAVPGLALLFSNFGFTSSWFALAAPFNTGIFTGQMLTVATGFALLLAVCQFFLGLARGLQNQAQISDWFAIAYFGVLGLLIAIVEVHRNILVSTSPDLPIAFLIGIVAWAVIVIANAPAAPSPKATFFSEAFIPLLLAAGTVTIKLIALPILAISFLLFAVMQKQWRKTVAGGVLAGLMLLPLMAHGIITSGCPLFPSTAICLALPWSPLAKSVQAVSDNTSNWVTWYKPPPGVNPWLWSFQQWFGNSETHKILLGFMVLSVVVTPFLARKAVLKRVSGQLWLLTSGLAGTLFVMKTAPVSRFLLPYTILLPTVAIALYCHSRFKSSFPFSDALSSRRPIAAVALVAVAALTTVAVRQPLQLLLPPRLMDVSTTQKQTNDIAYRSPIGEELCWNTVIPCAFQVEKEVRLRDPNRGIQAGFVHQALQK